MKKFKLPPKKEIRGLLVALKKDICDEYRCSDDWDDDKPGMSVTIGANRKGEWNYQTGDNSFTGGAYGFKNWAVVSLYRDSNCNQLADDVRDQLAELICELD